MDRLKRKLLIRVVSGFFYGVFFMYGVSRTSLERYLSCPFSFVIQENELLYRVFKRPRGSTRIVVERVEGSLVEESVRRDMASDTLLSRAVRGALGAGAGGLRVYRRVTVWLPYGGLGLPDGAVETSDGRLFLLEVKRVRSPGSWRIALQLEWYLYGSRYGVVWVRRGDGWERVRPDGLVYVARPSSSGGLVRVRVVELRRWRPELVSDEALAAAAVAKWLARDAVVLDAGLKRMKDCLRCPYRHICPLFREKDLVAKEPRKPPVPVIGQAWARALLDHFGLEEGQVAGLVHGDAEGAERVVEAVEESARRPPEPLERSLEFYGVAPTVEARKAVWERTVNHLSPIP